MRKECGSLPDTNWIATGLRPRDDKTGTDSQYTHFVIARRERERTTRQSTACKVRVRINQFTSRITVDRHGLRPRDDNYRGWKQGGAQPPPHTHVIARSERSDRRRNPLHVIDAFRHGSSLPRSQDRHGLGPHEDNSQG